MNHPYYNGSNNIWSLHGSSIVNTQLIYDTELDCILDIVTEPDNVGLKVYKHQVITESVRDESTLLKYAYFKRVPKNDFDFDYWAYFTEDGIKEYNLKHPDNQYENPYSDLENQYLIESYECEIRYWVEAFLQ